MMLRALATALAAAVTLAIVGCANGPSGGPNLTAARADAIVIRKNILAQIGAEHADSNEGTVACESADGQGVDWSSYTEFEWPSSRRGEERKRSMRQAGELLAKQGYELQYNDATEFYAENPAGASVTLAGEALTIFVGCTVD